MNGEAQKPKSRLYALQPLIRLLPEVEVPKRHVSFREKFFWSALALLLFLVMTQVPLYGVERQTQSFFGALRYVLASHAGSLVELGIGPIVTAGIIMQLLVGAKLIGLDLRDREDRALFTGAQKLFSILMAFFQGGALVMGGWYTRGGTPLPLETRMVVLGQLVLGALVVMYLDELVSKYGFGSGIGLFILGGVATEV
ncbi:MAG: preprotein translocase subunit SecY, partial [Hadesarchaea archaeon]|nr:preprotein translocase subunit SecY [Hadesarchaea archaeon]